MTTQSPDKLISDISSYVISVNSDPVAHQHYYRQTLASAYAFMLAFAPTMDSLSTLPARIRAIIRVPRRWHTETCTPHGLASLAQPKQAMLACVLVHPRSSWQVRLPSSRPYCPCAGTESKSSFPAGELSKQCSARHRYPWLHHLLV